MDFLFAGILYQLEEMWLKIVYLLRIEHGLRHIPTHTPRKTLKVILTLDTALALGEGDNHVWLRHFRRVIGNHLRHALLVCVEQRSRIYNALLQIIVLSPCNSGLSKQQRNRQELSDK